MPSPLGPPQLSLRDPETTLEELEAARLRFRRFCYEEVAGPREAVAQLRELCHQWLQPESHSKERMIELLVLEQFLDVLPPEIRAWMRGQRPGGPEEAVTLIEGLQHDPGQLLGWITSHILKPKMLLTVKKTEESLGSHHISVTDVSSETDPEEGSQDARMDKTTQLSCSVKEEPGAEQDVDMSPNSLPAQSSQGHLRSEEPASTSFHPGRSQKEWGLLDSTQKELCWDMLLEKYGTVVSQGLPPLEPEARAESDLTPPEQETPHVGPESSYRSHLPGVEAIAGPGPGLCQACPSPSGDSLSPFKDPPGLSLVPLPEARVGLAPKKPYTCEQCGLGFDWKSVSSSITECTQSYTCEECGRCFSWKSQLVIHRKSHMGQRRHF